MVVYWRNCTYPRRGACGIDGLVVQFTERGKGTVLKSNVPGIVVGNTLDTWDMSFFVPLSGVVLW